MNHPKLLRLTFKDQREPSTWEYGYEGKQVLVPGALLPPLGFAQVYEPHLKTFAKKQQTQDAWAYGLDYFRGKDSDTYEYDEQGRVYSKSYQWVEHVQVWKSKLVQEHLQPRVIENVPLEGFRIQKSVSRYSTSNKLWRVLDPRGFELEIATGCFEELVMDCVIDHGVIMAPCIWHTGKILVKA